MINKLIITAMLCIPILLPAQQIFVDSADPVKGEKSVRHVNPSKARVFEVDFEQLKTYLFNAPDKSEIAVEQSTYTLELPMPDGENHLFRFTKSIHNGG